MAFRARFIPRNPDKYVGDVDKIFARSSWELHVMKFFDSRQDVIRWGSEEIIIPFLNPIDSKVHRYFPDFFVEYKDKNGNILKEIVEVKPLHESDRKHAKKIKNDKDLTWRDTAIDVNEAKWKSAAIYCEARGMAFRVITEKSIFHQVEKLPRKKKVLV